MQLLTFMLGDVKFGIELEQVKSIEQKMQIVSVPNVRPYIRGIMNLHGNVIPVYSLPVKFGYENVKVENIIVVEENGMRIGFEVCKVQEILNVSDKDVHVMPAIIKHSQNCFSEVASSNKNLIVTLDVGNLLTEEEREDMQKMLANEETV
ncbi:MAG: purine-binding chemotaxis protein CheW [Lachnospiraceae bacterium]|nr:purine-binding chemotaxis protein CheW [Lachnospiraceae bacterium]